MITAVFAGSLVGDFLPVQVIYEKTNWCYPRFDFLAISFKHQPDTPALVILTTLMYITNQTRLCRNGLEISGSNFAVDGLHIKLSS